MQNDFVVMAKPVGSRCNMRCDYCYYLGKERPAGPRMTDALLERFIRSYIDSSAGPVVSFTWHDGEPTLAGLDFYRLAVELQKKYLPNGWTCWNSLQTNGILLDGEWCEFLSENRFDVGLSLDGTEAVHDKYRRDAGGNGTCARAEAAVRLLQANGLQPDLLCTVNASTAKEPLSVYRGLRSMNTGWMQFIPIVRRNDDGGLTLDSVTGEAYGDFLCAVFDQWAYNDLGKLEVQLFAETALVKAGGEARLCWMAPVCGRALIVEQDGGVYSCDHFVDDGHLIGNIDESSLSELAGSPAQKGFGNGKRDSIPAQCKACRWLVYCNGGCPKDRFAVTENGEPGLNILCEGFRRFFSHADAVLDKIISLRKNGFAPAAVMAALRLEAKSKWKGVGRNDPCPCGSGRKAKNCCWEQKP